MVSGRLLCCLTMVIAMGAVVTSVDYGPGTTPRMKEIFTGRCLEYQHVLYKKQYSGNLLNCTQMWDLFSSAFAYKDICGVVPEDFRPFMQEAMTANPPGKLMLWSHTGALSNLVDVGREFYTIETTLVGHVVDAMRWCGQVGEPGIAYDQCLKWWECQGNETNSEASYWRAGSKILAENTVGQVHALLNGTYKSTTFTNTSVFATIEIPNLNPNKVTEFIAWVVHDLDKPVKEKCGTGTLVDLEKVVKARGIKYSCVDDPPMTFHLQCALNPQSQSCKPKPPCRRTNGAPAPSLSLGLSLLPLLAALKLYQGIRH